MATRKTPDNPKEPTKKRTPAKKPAVKRPPGRPSKLTPEVQERIIQALTAGNYQDVAARYAGIDPRTFHRWMEQGADPNGDDQYRQFRLAVESARSQAEVRAVALINQAAQGGTWQAAAWFLERSHPQRWARLQRTELTGKDGGPIEIDAESLEKKIADALGEP